VSIKHKIYVDRLFYDNKSSEEYLRRYEDQTATVLAEVSVVFPVSPEKF
jgi:hypothetical protein